VVIINIMILLNLTQAKNNDIVRILCQAKCLLKCREESFPPPNCIEDCKLSHFSDVKLLMEYIDTDISTYPRILLRYLFILTIL